MSGSSTPASWMFVVDESSPTRPAAGRGDAAIGVVPEPPSSPPPKAGTSGRGRRGGTNGRGGGTWRRA